MPRRLENSWATQSVSFLGKTYNFLLTSRASRSLLATIPPPGVFDATKMEGQSFQHRSHVSRFFIAMYYIVKSRWRFDTSNSYSQIRLLSSPIPARILGSHRGDCLHLSLHICLQIYATPASKMALDLSGNGGARSLFVCIPWPICSSSGRKYPSPNRISTKQKLLLCQAKIGRLIWTQGKLSLWRKASLQSFEPNEEASKRYPP